MIKKFLTVIIVNLFTDQSEVRALPTLYVQVREGIFVYKSVLVRYFTSTLLSVGNIMVSYQYKLTFQTSVTTCWAPLCSVNGSASSSERCRDG